MSAARDQIINTTCELLELQGYHATGLNAIIKESGSPKGSLYYYFPGGKEELTSTALRHAGGMVQRRIQDNLAQADDAAEAVRRYIRLIAASVEATGYRSGGPITAVALETASTSERLRDDCHQIYREWQGLFAEKLTESGFGAARASSLAAVIVAAIEGGIVLSRTARSPQPLEQVAEAMGTLIAATRK